MTRPNTLAYVIIAVLITLTCAPIASAHYSPDLGRWLERDPLGMRPTVPTAPVRIGGTGVLPADNYGDEMFEFAPELQYSDGMNLYEYVRSAPANHTDPLGLFISRRYGYNPTSCEKQIRDEFIRDYNREKRRTKPPGVDGREWGSYGGRSRWDYCVNQAGLKAWNNSKSIPIPGGGGSRPLPGRADGPSDAIRHCIWACEITRRCGASLARRVTTAHEICAKDGKDGRDPGSQMDLCNNDVGISIGSQGKDCVEGCRDAYRLNRLCILCP